jgi:sialic acid synthase SpsE
MIIRVEKKMSDHNHIFDKPYLIAEIGVNYYDIAKKENISLLNAAKLMIDKAKEGGADAVKFQSYKAESLASKDSPGYWDKDEEPTDTQFDLFKKFDFFGVNEYTELAEYCNKVKIDFLSTPFDFDSVDYLDDLVKYYKVASADITHYPLLEKIADKGKPVFLSTGASTVDEIKGAIDIIQDIDSEIEIVLMHCVLSYPTKNVDANLKRIKHLKNNFEGFEIGYSDHTRPDENMVILSAAYVFGAKVIEKHFTLDKTLPGNDHYHAMNVDDLKKIRYNLEILNEVLSKDEKDFLKVEEISRKNARRSIVLAKDMKKGQIITEEDIIIKRPGVGISPTEYYNVLGKKINKDLKEDHILKREDLE